MSAPALRPFLPADTPVLAAIFVASIEGLTAGDECGIGFGAVGKSYLAIIGAK